MEMSTVADLTICSASFHSQRYVDLNNTLLSQLSSGYKWLISQNGPPEQFTTNVQVVPGNAPNITSSTDAPLIYEASFHHAASLNQLSKLVKTKYMLVLDPDFFIIQPIDEIVEYMSKNKIDIFGAPYNPTSLKHYKYFPAAFCMFINIDTITDIDFTPGYNNNINTGLKPDTGYKIYSNYIAARSETVIPTCAAPPSGYDKSRCTTKLFKSKGYYDAAGLGWEEFYFNGKPFAVHTHMKIHGKMQRHTKDIVDAYISKQLTQIEQCVTSIRKHDKLI